MSTDPDQAPAQAPDLFGYTPPAHSAEPNIEAHGDDHRGHWPERLQDLHAAVTAALTRDGHPDADKIASIAVLCLAEHVGGRQIYLPTGAKVRHAIQHAEIMARFTGNNVSQLAQEYRMAEASIYRIIDKQRRLQRRR